MKKIQSIIISVCAALAVMFTFSACDKNIEDANSVSDGNSSTVYKVGNTYTSLTAQKFFAGDGSKYTLQDDLNAGKIVILSFWYIGATPCEEQISYLGEIAADDSYSDVVSVVVMHSGDTSRDTALKESAGTYFIESYITQVKKWDFYGSVTWTIDTEDADYFTELGGSSAYPITVVIDSSGVIRYTSAIVMTKDTILQEISEITAS